jgi:type II secretory pathway component PulC
MLITTKWQQKIILGAMITLFAAVCITAIYSIWQWRNDWILVHHSPISPPTLAKSNQENDIINTLLDRHLFGKPAAPSLSNVPISSLQLSVTGIIKTNNGQSKVSISRAGAPSKIYKIGDVVTSGVKIYDITADTIVLENDGRMEKLPMVREKLQFKPRALPENP